MSGNGEEKLDKEGKYVFFLSFHLLKDNCVRVFLHGIQ